MSSQSERKQRIAPLFVNHLQICQYGSSPKMPADEVSDEGFPQPNVFQRFSTSPDMDVAVKQFSKASRNDVQFSYKFDPVSPIFGPQKRPLTSSPCVPARDRDGMRTAGKDVAFTQHLCVDECPKSPLLTESEDSDKSSPVLTSRYHKRQRLHRRPVLIDSDNSDDCDVQVHGNSSECVSDRVQQNNAVARNSIHRSLEDRHCFDLLLNRDCPNIVKKDNSMQSLQRSSDEPVIKNDTHRYSLKSYSQPSWDSGEEKLVDRRLCSVRLHKLQLCDVPHRHTLSQEDRLLLSGLHSSVVNCKTSTVNRDNQFASTDDLIHPVEADVDHDSVVQSANVHYHSSDDLFSDNEMVESVCLSANNYCSTSEQNTDVDNKHTVKSGELSDQDQSEVPFVSYSQAEDDCILIDDSDDELFANLTQNDMDAEVKEESGSTDDDVWIEDDTDTVTAAVSGSSVGEMFGMLEVCDPWLTDVADISSDELENAYDAAMSFAHHPDGQDDSVATGSVASQKHTHLKMSPCSVSLKRLRMGDIPRETRPSQEQKHVHELDIDNDNSQSVKLFENATSCSVSCENSNTGAFATHASFDEWCRTSRFEVFQKFNESESACDTNETAQNSDVKHKCDKRGTGARTPLEKCVEVVEFYGTNLTRASKENRQHECESVLNTKLDNMSNTENVNSAKHHRLTEDQFHSPMVAPVPFKPQKHDTVKPKDDYASEEMKLVQYQKISQMRDWRKQNLRKDKTSFTSGRRLQNDCSDRFMGLSQFSVAKRQLSERNRQLKTSG